MYRLPMNHGPIFSRLWENYFNAVDLRGGAPQNKKGTSPKDAQKGRPARPQRVKDRSVPAGVR
jgi:hypothetical protein